MTALSRALGSARRIWQSCSSNKAALESALAKVGDAYGNPDPLVEGNASTTRCKGRMMQASLMNWTKSSGQAKACLYDGRARNLTGAIMWHGGEAETRNRHFPG